MRNGDIHISGWTITVQDFIEITDIISLPVQMIILTGKTSAEMKSNG
jgi:hypothetical protein